MDMVDHKLLQTLVPVNALTVDHLSTLLRNHSVEVICQGQTIVSSGENDNCHIYLLSGEVLIKGDDSKQKRINASDPICHFAIAQGQPRRATVVANTDCSIIRFDSDKLDGMLAWDQAAHYIMLDIAAQRELDEDADWMLTLLKSNLFYKVPPMNIRQILNKFKAQYVAAGETIIRQGEMGDCCYFIKEGSVAVYQSAGEASPSELVNELSVGRCFGEDALVNDMPRNATLKMQSNGVLMRLEKQDFYLLLKQPAINTVELAAAQSLLEQGAVAIDVRTQAEYEHGHGEGAMNMPLDLLKLKSRMLDPDTQYICYCDTGRRSDAATYLLTQDGFNVLSLRAGFSTYSSQQLTPFNVVRTPLAELES